jgi:glyoxylase-like metal-dependent hydrolase (beta-lactamase superfamily II)
VELGTATRPLLVRWTCWLPVAATSESYALLTAEGPILIDPREPAEAEADSLWALLGQPPVATVLTNDWHERDAYLLRERFGAPVWAPAAGQPERGGDLEGQPDHYYDEGDMLPGGLRATKIEGRMPGDTVLLWPGDADAGDASAAGVERRASETTSPRQRGRPGVLFTGDALNGQANPDNPLNASHLRRRPGLYLGAARYYLGHPDPDRLKDSLRRLVAASFPAFDIICGAHALPYRTEARRTLAQLLALDWRPFLAAEHARDREHPAVLTADCV